MSLDEASEMNLTERDVKALNPSASTGQMSVEAARAFQEVQGQIVMAKKFPRSLPTVITNILQACQRKFLAEQSMYSYPRGGSQVTGPSIRLAEELARQFGNIDYGVKELEQKDGESVVMSYAWDLETNVRQTKVFTVKHERDTKKGKQYLKDSRDIYELVANSGARRLRACILGVIPSYITEEALDACEKTLTSEVNKTPLVDQVSKMLSIFTELGVTKEMLEGKLRHKLEATNPTEIVQMRKVYVSLRDGQSKLSDWFDVKEAGMEAGKTKADELNERLKQTKEKKD